MIVVDSSVWIDFLRHTATAQVDQLIALLDEEELLLGDLVLCEVLRGARSEGEAIRIKERLGVLPVVAMVGRDVAEQAALHHRLLRRRGITVRNTVDLLIGTFCIVNRYRLLHSDRDFLPMVEHLGLAEA